MEQPGAKREMGGRAPLAPPLATALLLVNSLTMIVSVFFYHLSHAMQFDTG